MSLVDLMNLPASKDPVINIMIENARGKADAEAKEKAIASGTKAVKLNKNETSAVGVDTNGGLASQTKFDKRDAETKHLAQQTAPGKAEKVIG